MINRKFIENISTNLNLNFDKVLAVVDLIFDKDYSIPFIARYRKELTGSMDETFIKKIRDDYKYMEELEENKIKYLKVIKEQFSKNSFKEKFEDIKIKVENCKSKQELEDIYIKFKPKRRSLALIAKSKGLEKLLDDLLKECSSIIDLKRLAKKYINNDENLEKDLIVKDEDDALEGAKHIYMERISEDTNNRSIVRKISFDSGILFSSKTGELENKSQDISKYSDYFNYDESINSILPHRIMAIRRGENAKILKVDIKVDDDIILNKLIKSNITDLKPSKNMKIWLISALKDAYKKFLAPAIETEIRVFLKEKGQKESINVFVSNLKNLLLLPPIPKKIVMGIDPGLRTGSKLAVVDQNGKYLSSNTIYHHKYDAQIILKNMIEKHKVQVIAIGNGTGSKETDNIVIETLNKYKLKNIKRVIVNESGASVYSADDIAREEFPDLDITIRSAISIARRLQDPLAELVKIDPRSIGIGQYQHDINSNKLSKGLEEVVESCVNKVGVNVNTASFKLLSYVAGIGDKLAKNIVEYRNKNGSFYSKNSLKKVNGFGPKAFEQSAGFLRVPESKNVLDNSAIHPERYQLINEIVSDLNKDIKDIIGVDDEISLIDWQKYIKPDIGLPTLKDIAKEMIKPGRDPREDGSRLLFSSNVSDIKDLKIDMTLKGTVTNVTKFGAFVDIGVHQDGLVHISELSDKFVDDPNKFINVGDIVEVRVIDINLNRSRIGLSMKSTAVKKVHHKKKNFDKNYTMKDLMAKFSK